MLAGLVDSRTSMPRSVQDISDEAELLLPELADDELWFEQTHEL